MSSDAVEHIFCNSVILVLNMGSNVFFRVNTEIIFGLVSKFLQLFHEPFTLFGALCCLVIFIGIYGVQRTAP